MPCSKCKDGEAISLSHPLRYLDIECPYQETRCSLCNKSAMIKKKIAEKIEEIEILGRELLDIRNEANETHNRLTQVLPTEIISRIFSLYVNSDQDDENRPKDRGPFSDIPHKRLRALKLGQISKTLRNIAWNTPNLWTNINLDVDADCPDKYLGLLRAFLSRSGSLPLNIRLYSNSWNTSSWLEKHAKHGIDKNSISRQFSKLVGVIAQRSRQWSRLAIIQMNMEFVIWLFELAQDVSNIKEFTLSCPFLFHSGYPNNFTVFRNGIPSPQTVDIHSDLSFKHINLDWTRVTDLEINSTGFQDFNTILQACPLLESLDVSYFGNRCVPPSSLVPSWPSFSSVITHSSLRYLSITLGSDQRQATTALSDVSFPRLCEIRVFLNSHIDTQEYLFLKALCSPTSSPSLNAMKLEFAEKVDKRIGIELIRLCHHSQVKFQLLLHGWNTELVPANFFDYCDSRPHGSRVSSPPLLEVLILKIPIPSKQGIKHILDTFDVFPVKESEREGALHYDRPAQYRRPLRILKLCTSACFGDNADIFDRFMEFVDAGVDVEWVDADGPKIFPLPEKI